MRIFAISLLIGLGVIALFWLGSQTFNDFVFVDAQEQNDSELINFADTDSRVVMTIDGEIAADKTHRAIRISVDEDWARIDLLRGYEREVYRSKRFENNNQAYTEFLRAIDIAGFARQNSNPDYTDERGVCATGTRTILELKQDGRNLQRLWFSSCDSNHGTSNAKRSTVQDLFKAQIPNYRDFTRSVDLT